ncbi:MAG: hypothetical protein JWR08_1694 [Enterovirga sp.]|jgi:hypothetical protein|nr:hypothetical protein [Enterovirga sp.]
MASDSVHEIEQDIEATRSRLYGTIDRIQDKLTVSGIVDEVMGSVGVPRSENGHDFVLGLMRRNPIPVMIVAAGVGWFFYNMSRRKPKPVFALTEDYADYVDVSVEPPQATRSYDPDLPGSLPRTDVLTGPRGLPGQA